MEMKWTFGIITDGNQWERVRQTCLSIPSDNTEIIVIGGEDQQRWPTSIESLGNVVYIPFDETIKNGWITRKKNLIAQNAKSSNLCIMHDYVALNPGWVAGFDRFGDDWLTCMTPIQNQDGRRFRDWCVIYNDAWMNPPIDDERPPDKPPGQLLDYSVQTGYERWQYFSGAYFCVKRDVMLEVPLDEERVWGQGEDVQWSRLLFQQYGAGVFSLNQNSSVCFLKQKERAPWERLAPLQ